MSIIEPPFTGYPDWQPSFKWDGPVLINETNIDGSGHPVFGPFPCNIWWGARYWIQDFGLTPGSSLGVNVTWFVDQALAAQVGQTSFQINDQTPVWEGVTVPNQGPWMSVEVQTPFTSSTTLVVEQTNRIGRSFVGDSGYAILSQPTFPVGAGVTHSMVPQSLFSGPATVNCTSTQDGTLTLVGNSPGYSSFTAPVNVTANVPVLVPWQLPFCPWRFDFKNTSGLGANITLLVLGDVQAN